MQRPPLIIYIIGVAIVWAAILCAMWFTGDIARFNIFALVCLGFALGMIAMWIATKIYRS